jgi:hypothetical protein
MNNTIIMALKYKIKKIIEYEGKKSYRTKDKIFETEIEKKFFFVFWFGYKQRKNWLLI